MSDKRTETPNPIISQEDVVSIGDVVRDFFDRVVNDEVAAALLKADGKNPTYRRLIPTEGIFQSAERTYQFFVFPQTLLSAHREQTVSKAQLFFTHNMVLKSKPNQTEEIVEFCQGERPEYPEVISIAEIPEGNKSVYEVTLGVECRDSDDLLAQLHTRGFNDDQILEFVSACVQAMELYRNQICNRRMGMMSKLSSFSIKP